MAELSTATAFWSYAHADDNATDGQVLELADKVRKAYAVLKGEPLEMFVDRDTLQWGEEWETKISSTIAGTTFFIPVITPSYLKSAFCRNEFLDFYDKPRNRAWVNSYCQLFLRQLEQPKKTTKCIKKS